MYAVRKVEDIEIFLLSRFKGFCHEVGDFSARLLFQKRTNPSAV